MRLDQGNGALQKDQILGGRADRNHEAKFVSAMTNLEKRIDDFRSSVVSSLLSPTDFVDWGAVSREMSQQTRAIADLQDFVDHGNLSYEALASHLSEKPATYPLLLSLLAFNASGSQIEKWGLPERVPTEPTQRQRLAKNLTTIGYSELFTENSRISDQLRVAEIYKDSFKRRFRSGNQFEKSVSGLVKKAVSIANDHCEEQLRSAGTSVLRHSSVARFLDHVIMQGQRPIAGIATVFQQQSGGRQQRELSVTYPTLQRNLRELGMSLVLIADGPGFQDASPRALQALFEGVRFPMTIRQAGDGELVDALLAASTEPEIAPLESAAVDRLIDAALNERGEVNASDLPLGSKEATLAMAKFAEVHRDLSIRMSFDGTHLEWDNREHVQSAINLETSFEPELAVKLFSFLMSADEIEIKNSNGDCDAIVEIDKVAPFPQKLFVKATGNDFDNSLAQAASAKSMEFAHDARFSVLILSEELRAPDLEEHRRMQSLRPVSIIVLSPAQLKKASKSSTPRALFVDELLGQADLSKVSPFVLSNATPSRMFFGREQEAAATLATISTNSVAILGSRRIGKTSLLRRLREDLKDANFSPFFTDCQTVRTWQDFANLAQRDWHVSVPGEFSPNHLTDLVQQLRQRSEDPVVILLDEIDQLLLWDMQHDENSVPEAFFRACRSISQSGAAQFVFTGERVISKKLWDPQSPHWNFCRPIQLTQLPRKDALELLLIPLSGLGIDLPQRSETSELVWRFTSGHPQLVQFLGDRLIRNLEVGRHNTSYSIDADDVMKVAHSFDYAEHYVSTYLGQANSLERAIARSFGAASKKKAQLRDVARSEHADVLEDEFETALRMLQLYGILEVEDNLFKLRADWLPEALTHFGASENASILSTRK